MKAQAAEDPPSREVEIMSMDDRDFELALDYAPESYDFFRPEKTGRWRTYAHDGRYLGVIWTDDDEGVGFLMADEDLIPGSHETATAVRNVLRAMKKQGVPVPAAYQAIQQTPGVLLGEEKTGVLKNAMELSNVLSNDDVITAAAGAPTGPNVNYNAAFDLETEEYAEFMRSDVNGISIYDNGEWHLLPEDSELVESVEWITLGDDGIEYLLSKIKSGETPTRDEILPFSTNN